MNISVLGNETRKSRAIFYIGLFCLYALVLLINIFNSKLPVGLVLVAFSLLVIISNKDETLALASCCIPFSVCFQYKYAILILVLISFAKFYSEISIKKVVFPFFMLLAWELLHGLIFQVSFLEYLRSFAEIILCVFVLCLKKGKRDYPFICRAFVLSWVFVLSILLLSLLMDNEFDFLGIFNGRYRFGWVSDNDSNYVVSFNPNMLGFLCILSMALVLQLICSRQHKKMDYVFLAVLFVYGIMSLSRAFVVCFLAMVAMFIFLSVESFGKRITKIFYVFVVLGLAIVAVYFYAPIVIKNFIGRFSESDLSNGRWELFSFYNQHIFSSLENFLFGIGLVDIEGKIGLLYPSVDINVCHNAIQEIVVAWGVFGLVLIFWFFVEIIREARSINKIRFINLIPLILLLLYVQFGQFISSGLSLLSLFVAIISMTSKIEEKGHEKT